LNFSSPLYSTVKSTPDSNGKKSKPKLHKSPRVLITRPKVQAVSAGNESPLSTPTGKEYKHTSDSDKELYILPSLNREKTSTQYEDSPDNLNRRERVGRCRLVRPVIIDPILIPETNIRNFDDQ